MDNGRVLHATRDGIHLLRYIGDIRYTLSPSIERYLDDMFSAPAPTGLIIDLTETDSIDSTNLGLLVRMAKRMGEHHDARVSIVSSRDDINSVLHSMALDEVFDIVSDTRLEAGEAEELPDTGADREGLAHTMLEAHRALMDLSEDNQEMFRDVVNALEKDTTTH